MRRRALLALAGGSLTAMSGCAAVTGSTDGRLPRLGEVSARNASPEPRTLALLVRRDGEIVYWQTHALAGAGDPSANEVVVRDEPWMATRGRWQVGARVVGGAGWEEVELGRSQDGCRNVYVTYDAGDPGGRALDLYAADCA